MSGIDLDITDKKRTEQQLAEGGSPGSRGARGLRFERLPAFERIGDTDGRVVDLNVVYVNPMAAKYCNSTTGADGGTADDKTIPGAKLAGGMIERHGRIIESGRPSGMCFLG